MNYPKRLSDKPHITKNSNGLWEVLWIKQDPEKIGPYNPQRLRHYTAGKELKQAFSRARILSSLVGHYQKKLYQLRAAKRRS